MMRAEPTRVPTLGAVGTPVAVRPESTGRRHRLGSFEMLLDTGGKHWLS